MLEILNSTSFIEKAKDDDVMLVLKIFLALDKFNDFIYFSKIKSKFEQRFGDEEVNAQIFNTMININNISTNIHLLKSCCSLINWKQNTKYINTQQEKDVFSTVLSNFFNNNDITNFDWFLSNTTLFKELKLMNSIMKFNFNLNSTKDSFLFSCLTNQHLKHSREELNDDMKEKLDKLLRYNSLKERNIIKSHTLNFEEESNHINKKRL